MLNAVAQTCRWAAAQRAVESEREDRLFNDPLARALAGDAALLLVRGKGGKERIVPLSDAAKDAAAAMVDQHAPDTRYLFHGRDPRRPLTRQAFFLLLKQVALRAGLDPARVSPHVLRHSFA